MSGSMKNPRYGNGKLWESKLEHVLKNAKFNFNPYARSIDTVWDKAHSRMLFEDGSIGQYGKQIKVPLLGLPNKGKNRTVKVDYALCDFKGNQLVVSVKSQEVNGTCDEKLWNDIQEHIFTDIPTALLILGPANINGNEGWRAEILLRYYDWIPFFGKPIFLFRSFRSFDAYLLDGMPVPGQGKRHEDIFNKYCREDPLTIFDLKE